MAVHCADPAAEPTSWFSATAGPSSALTAGVGAGAVLTARVLDPDAVDHGPVLCPFRLLTGLPCPGCGLTRSWVHLVHGQWVDGVTANPFGLLALAFAFGLLAATALAAVRRRPLPSVGQMIAGRAFRVVLSAWLAFGLVRIALVAAG